MPGRINEKRHLDISWQNFSSLIKKKYKLSKKKEQVTYKRMSMRLALGHS